MWEASLQGLLAVLQPNTMLVMAIGIVTSTIVAILPGIGSTTLLAMAMPFAMTMTPPLAIALMVSIHAVANTASGLTSSLTGIPGSSASTATILDGYPMAKKGQGARAVGAAIWSSVLGGVVGAIVLTFSLPMLRPLVMALGAPEYFMLSLWGLSMIGMLSGKAIFKGLAAGGIGMMIAMIGLDPKSGTERWVFGQPYLWDGIDLVLVSMGIYAIPEVIGMAMEGTSIAGDQPAYGGGLMQGVKDCFKYWFLLVRSSVIGVWLGMIPGIGGPTAAWIAYGHATTSEKNGNFGKGDVRGVIAPEACNNSVDGGGFITSLGFGIPTSTSVALILIVFLAVGIQPGPSMLNEQLPLTFAVIWTLTIANVVAGFGSLALAKPIAKMTFWPFHVVVPVIAIMVLVGAYTANYQIVDLVMLLIFSVLGFFMKQFRWPRAPLLLGLVLGPVMEKYLWLSTGTYGAAWLVRPGVIILFCLIIATSIGAPMWQKRQKKKEEGQIIQAV